MKIPFGKHKGEEICDIDLDYLKWLEEQDWFHEKFPKHLKEVQHEISKVDDNRPGKGFVKS